MILALLKLVRFPLILTAVADSVTGAMLSYSLGLISSCGSSAAVDWSDVQWCDWPLLAWVAGASACLYCGGMVLNDVADANRDRELHPDRPIPSGRIRREAALFVGFAFMVAGAVLAVAASLSAVVVVAGVICGILLYNFILKRWAVPGSLAMGLVRGLNFFMGMVFFDSVSYSFGDALRWWYFPALVVGYVFVLTLISSLEESAEPRRYVRALTILQGLVVLMIPAVLPGQLDASRGIGAGAASVFACVLVLSGWKVDSREKIMAHVRRSILLIIVVDAVMLLCTGLPGQAVVVLALLIPSYGMVLLYRHV